MQTDLLGDFLRLVHRLYPARASLTELLARFDNNPRELLACDDASLVELGLQARRVRRLRDPVEAQVEADLDWQLEPNHHLVTYLDDAYPALLREIADFPLLLYVQGDVSQLKRPQVALVGSRNCTPGGAQNALEFAGECAAAGLVITSGLALGIDAAAHQGALEAGGNTIAVIGTGIDRTYPQRHQRLARHVAGSGAIVSEFPLGCPARAAHFPQRNRIISGLAMATVVIEAAERSGSLITARLAAEQGREVLAIPGSIHNPQSRGCHRLIRDGATLAQTPADVIAELGGLFQFTQAGATGQVDGRKNDLDAAQLALLESIGYDPVDCDILVQRSGLTIDKLSSMLVTLELNDLIQSAPGGCYVRI